MSPAGLAPQRPVAATTHIAMFATICAATIALGCRPSDVSEVSPEDPVAAASLTGTSPRPTELRGTQGLDGKATSTGHSPTSTPRLTAPQATEATEALKRAAVKAVSWMDGPRSPDGLWTVRRAWSERSEPPDGLEEDFISLVVAGPQITHTIIAEWTLSGIGVPSPAVLGWLPDSSAVFVYNASSGDGCVITGGGDNLRHVSLPSGDVTVLPVNGGEASLSSDGRWLIAPHYAAVAERELESIAFAVVDTVTLESKVASVHVPGASPDPPGWGPEVGQLQWSPENNLVAAGVITNPCSEKWRHGVVVVDPEIPAASVLLAAHPDGVERQFRWETGGVLDVAETTSPFAVRRPFEATQVSALEAVVANWRRIDARTGDDLAPPEALTELHRAPFSLVRVMGRLHKADFWASMWFSGDMGPLIDSNPSLPPDDREQLLAAGCVDQLRCLEVYDVIGAIQLADDRIEIGVRLRDANGSVFELTPCCEVGAKTQSVFTFTVKAGGAGGAFPYQIETLPPFVP